MEPDRERDPRAAIIALQHDAGNRAVIELLAGAGSRAKLPVQLQIETLAPPARSTSHRTLRPGDQGDDVRVLQHKLNTAGADPALRANAVVDAPTQTAVRDFQRRKGLSADGVAGPQTWAALDQITAGRSMDEATLAEFGARKVAADALFEANQFAAAEVAYRAIYADPRIDPSARSGVTFSLGSSVHALGRFDEAISLYQEVLALPAAQTSEFRLDAAQRIREARLGQPPGVLASVLNAAPVPEA